MTEIGVDKINLLTKRNLERKLDLQKRKEGRDLLSAENEKLGFFEETFVEKRNYIDDLIQKSLEVDKSQLPEHFNVISKEILVLQKYVASSNLFLRSYDIKKCQEKLQELSYKARDLEDELLPKKKFGFKNRLNKVKPIEEKPKDEVDFRKSAIISKNLRGFANKTAEELVMKNEELYKNDVAAENLENCTVKLFGTPSTLHLNCLKDCRVFTGPVSTSIFAENCENCTLVIACQQLRLHSSKNVKIYLHVTSRAIMEDCTGILITPYNWNYEGLEKDFKESGLDIATNHWKCVDDFNWLNIEKQSPNWRVLDEELIENFSNV